MKPMKESAVTEEPAFNVVVYCEPGPNDSVIAAHAGRVVASKSRRGSGGGLGYVTFVQSDFDRLWNGVEEGDILGTAYAVLPFLGPNAEQFIGRENDFHFEWVGLTDEEYGKVLLLQITPRPHLLAVMK